jgi:hypothetical protein
MTTTAVRLEKARTRRQDVSKFSAYIKTPKAGGSLTLPANGMFALVPKAVAVANGAAMTLRSSRSPVARNIGTPALAAGERYVVGFLERGNVCTPTAAFDLYVDAGLGKWRPVLIGG